MKFNLQVCKSYLKQKVFKMQPRNKQLNNNEVFDCCPIKQLKRKKKQKCILCFYLFVCFFSLLFLFPSFRKFSTYSNSCFLSLSLLWKCSEQCKVHIVCEQDIRCVLEVWRYFIFDAFWSNESACSLHDNCMLTVRVRNKKETEDKPNYANIQWHTCSRLQ